MGPVAVLLNLGLKSISQQLLFQVLYIIYHYFRSSSRSVSRSPVRHSQKKKKTSHRSRSRSRYEYIYLFILINKYVWVLDPHHIEDTDIKKTNDIIHRIIIGKKIRNIDHVLHHVKTSKFIISFKNKIFIFLF
jgi:hypothetical protein